jgi:hypothetical protein
MLSRAAAFAMPSTGKAAKTRLVEDNKPGGEDNLGITIFLQGPATGECHETGGGFLVQATSLKDAQELAPKMTKKVRTNLRRSISERDESECSHYWGSSSATEADEIMQPTAFFRFMQCPWARALSSAAVHHARSRFGFYPARYMHWVARMRNIPPSCRRKSGRSGLRNLCEWPVQPDHETNVCSLPALVRS